MSLSIEQCTPIAGNVIVQWDRGEERIGSIIKPYDEKERGYYTGTVLAAGPKASVSKGERIMFDRYVRDQAFIFGYDSNILIMDASEGEGCDVLGVFEEEVLHEA